MILLKGLFFLIIVGVVLFLATVARLLWSARELLQSLLGGSSRRQHTTQGDAAGGHGTVSDRRSPEEASRRIIADDEGEYVEYEEIP